MTSRMNQFHKSASYLFLLEVIQKQQKNFKGNTDLFLKHM